MWKDLPMRQRADLMHTYLKYGITSLDEMRNHYDSTISSQENKTVTKNMSAYGGHIYDGTSERSQKMNRPNIFRYDDGRYVYQAAPNAEEIDVTPINTLMPDASQWTYQDAEGKIYTPNSQAGQTGRDTLTEAEDTNPLMRAANNYFSELSWRAQNDPSSIALQGKYTMPIVLSPLLAKAGEAAYAAGYTPYINAGLTSAFATHGLNHWMNEGIDSGWDAAMTALEIAPLGRLAKPMFNEAALAIENYRYPLGRPQVPEGYLTVKPQVRTRIGDVEIDNPGLYYHQSDAGKAENFVSTGRMRTPLEEYWLAKEEAGERIPLAIQSGAEPGYPQDPGSAMFAQGKLWYGLTPNKPDLLVTAREMPIANKNASIMSNKASLRALEEQGSRRVTNDNIYTQGPHNRQNTAAYTWEPGYGYRKVFAEETPTIEWTDAARTPQITAENAANRTQEIQNLIPRYNKFAEYYGYDTVPEGVSAQEAENLIKEGLKQHNTFYRGLTYPEGEKLEAVKKVLGENASREEVMDYLAKAGSRDPNNTYFSLDERANQYARTGDVARYTRKYTLGDNPATWLEDADFAFDTTPATSFAPRGSVNYPWAGSYIKEVPGEVRINPEDVTFEGWMPKTTWEYGEYVKPSEYRANKNLYFNENAGGKKPTFPFLLKNR